MKDKKKILSMDNPDPQELISKYFQGFCLKPSVYEISLLIDNLKNFEEEPSVHLLADRKKFDPYYVAKKAISEAKLKWKSTGKISDSGKPNGQVVDQNVSAESVVDKNTEIHPNNRKRIVREKL